MLAVAFATAACTAETTSSADACVPDRPERIAAAPLRVENLITQPATTGPDTDGDRRPDEMTVEAGEVMVERGDGQLVFARPGHDVALQNHADLDGDGRDDLILNEEGEVYVVSGTTSPGLRTPAEAGVHVDPHLTEPWTLDLVGASGRDFLVRRRGATASTTDVYDGAAVLARGAGSDARGLAPARRLVGLVRAAVPLVPGGPRETLLYVPGDPAEVRIAERPGAVLRALARSSRVEDLIVFDEGGVRKIALQVDGRVAIWRVPPACPS